MTVCEMLLVIVELHGVKNTNQGSCRHHQFSCQNIVVCVDYKTSLGLLSQTYNQLYNVVCFFQTIHWFCSFTVLTKHQRNKFASIGIISKRLHLFVNLV